MKINLLRSFALCVGLSAFLWSFGEARADEQPSPIPEEKEEAQGLDEAGSVEEEPIIDTVEIEDELELDPIELEDEPLDPIDFDEGPILDAVEQSTEEGGPLPWESEGSKQGALRSFFERVKLDIGGGIFTRLHYRFVPIDNNRWFDRKVLPDGFTRNENTFKLKIEAQYGPVTGVVDINLDWLAHQNEIQVFNDLTVPQNVIPIRFDANALYIELSDFIVDGLDLRVGQQIVKWGVGDQFNPTDNLNALDLENPLLFGKRQGNVMLRLDYLLSNQWSATAAVVPIFRPAILPTSAQLGPTMVERLPFNDAKLRQRITSERLLALEDGYPTVVDPLLVNTPDFHIRNTQAAIKVAGSLFSQDISLSYYHGFTDIPFAVSNHSVQTQNIECDPQNEASCIDGKLSNRTELVYPQIDVLGLNLSGELPLFGKKIAPLGYRLELGVYFPQETRASITQETITVAGITQAGGEYPYPAGEQPTVLESTPFAKWVLGLDYTLGRHVYLNAMWVHGMPDEIGAGDFITEGFNSRNAYLDEGQTAGGCVVAFQLDIEGVTERCVVEELRPKLGDYVVLGVDLKFLEDRALIRLFTIWDFTGVYFERFNPDTQQRERTYRSIFTREGFSATLFPEFRYNFGYGFQMSLGALILLGKKHSKFGDPAAGGSMAFMRASYEF